MTGLRELLSRPGEWLRGTGASSEVVMSSRVRLARNLARFHFALSMSPEEKRELADAARAELCRLSSCGPLSYFALDELGALERRMLVERHLISREHEEAEGARGVALRDDESVSIMVNEEDHLRLQALQSGLELEKAWAVVDAADTEIGKLFDLAYDSRLGFLTACPTNVGTGLRASVMLHLPALVMSRHIEKAFRAIAKLNLAVRGFYGEGTEALGDFYQISNQLTLGRGETEVLEDLKAVIAQVVNYELAARQGLIKKDKAKLEDRIWRSYALLSNARIISSEEAMAHLSSVRLGLQTGLLSGPPLSAVNEAFLLSQPAHLQEMEGKELAPDERDEARATLLRRILSSGKS